jgi:hypothetical protein
VSETQGTDQPTEPDQPTAPSSGTKRRRLVMIGSGPDYVDGDIRVLPEDADRLIRLGHARSQGRP